MRATLADVPRLVGMARKFHEQAGQPFGFNAEAMTKFMGALVEAGGVFLTERGFIAGVIHPAYCDPDWLMAIELMWWAEGDGVRLLGEFEAWAADAGANEVRMTSLGTLERAGRLLSARGYDVAETSHRRLI